jgi:hypothetical protein
LTVDPADFDRLPAPPRTLPAPGFALDVVEHLVVFRLHWETNPLRPKRHPHGRYRFDAPRDGAEYPVTYANLADHGAFAEVYGDTQLISEQEADRRLSTLVATRQLRLIALDEPTIQKTLHLDGAHRDVEAVRDDDAVEPGAASLVPGRRRHSLRVATRRRTVPQLLLLPRP